MNKKVKNDKYNTPKNKTTIEPKVMEVFGFDDSFFQNQGVKISDFQV